VAIVTVEYNLQMNEQTRTDGELTANAQRELVSEILARLDTVYTPSDWEPSGKPVDELVGTILSQNTSDTNTHRAFASLKQKFQAWQDVVEGPVEEVVDAIRSGGLAQQKAPRIQKALSEVLSADEDDPNDALFWKLKSTDSEEAMLWLTSMQGIGPKTAACVLLFAVGKPVVPVDTHVFRVSKRLGLISSRSDANRAHGELLDIVPPDDSYRFHIHLIHHGRTICKSRKPRCTDCVLEDVCLYRNQSRLSE
jgi:endonuclease III